MTGGACGFPVQVTVVASGIDRSYEQWPGGLVYLGTVREEITFSVGTNTVTFHERVQEQARANSDGTFAFSVTGAVLRDRLDRALRLRPVHTGTHLPRGQKRGLRRLVRGTIRVTPKHRMPGRRPHIKQIR